MTPAATKDRILDAAEKLFADNGFAGTSLRAITSEAGVNLAAVNYHFGSKAALIQAVFHRILGPVNQRRLEGLDALEAGGSDPDLSAVLRAFLEPAMDLYRTPRRGGLLVRLFGRLYAEPGEGTMELFVAEFSEVFRRFNLALGRLLPHVDGTELLWRFHFMVGAMAHTVAHRELMKSMSPRGCELGDTDETLERLIVFLEAAFRADNAQRPTTSAKKSR